jgi:hypothetical protein
MGARAGNPHGRNDGLRHRLKLRISAGRSLRLPVGVDLPAEQGRQAPTPDKTLSVSSLSPLIILNNIFNLILAFGL